VEKNIVTRAVIVKFERLPRRLFSVFVELEGIYRNMVIQLLLYAVRSSITSFIRLKALKYSELRSIYPNIPSHYVYTACQYASLELRAS